MKIKRLEIPLYLKYLFVCACKTKKEFVDYLQKRYGIQDSGSPLADAATFMGDDGRIYVWFAPPASNETIVHESLHIIVRILTPKGIALNYETEEAFAYLQEWLYSNMRRYSK